MLRRSHPLLASGIRRPALFLFSAIAMFGQTEWRSTLYPADWTPPTGLSFETDRLIQDFSYAGYRRGEVEIPNLRSPEFDVTSFGADPTGALDSTVPIQNAINAAAAAGGGVVALPAGTFRVSPQGNNAYALRISTSNIVLRGAGRGRTFIFNDSYAMRSRQIIRVEGSGSSWSTVPAGSPQPMITADLLTPTVFIPVASVAGLAVGDWVILRADATDAFIAEHNMTDLWGGRGSSLGGVMFQRRITAIDEVNQRLTIDVPIRYYLKTRDNARVHRAVPHIEEIGLEDFSIGNREHASSASRTGWGEEDYNTPGNGSYDAHGSFAIGFLRVRNAWISHVGSYRPSVNTLDTHLLSNGILLQNCAAVTVRHGDFQRPLFGGGGGNGYMYRLQASNDCLIRDSAARYNRHGFVFSHMACSGNVIHGGIGQVTRVQVAGAGTTSGEGSDHHMHLSQSNLIDGVQLEQDFFTAHYRGTAGTPPQHGQTAVHSVYWNLVGLAYHLTKNFIVRSEQARYGYMIGTRGPASGMTTTSGAPAARTAPVDHAEGAGLGATLQPLSLYHDQLRRRLGRLPVPPSPTALSAAAGITEVTLRWYPSATAASYRVRRATASGGPYTVIGTTAQTRFVDTGLTTGRTYYYTVAAVNAAGEGSDTFETAATPARAYQQEADEDGIVSFEAEHFDANVAQGGHAWTVNTTEGHSGDCALEATPNNGTTRDSGFTATSPRLDFRVNFAQAGTYHVWLRGIGRTGNDDSVHAGLDGAVVASADRISGFGTSWTWRNTTTDGPGATLVIPAPGLHTINVWMREDGVILDKLVLTLNAGYTPAGPGPAASPRIGAPAPPGPGGTARIINLAARALVGGAAGTPIAGFVIGGTGAKRMIVRAVGPGLTAFGLAGTVPNPTLSVVSAGRVVASNERWNAADAGAFAGVGAFALPAGSSDAAVVTSLAAGGYTTPVRAATGSGLVLLEMYDADAEGGTASLINASTRAFVGLGDEVLIPGFVIAGEGEVRLLIRAVGPTLTSFGVEQPLADPEITLFREGTAIAGNDNWSAAPNAVEMVAVAPRVGAFSLPGGNRDAALLVSLPGGAYTARVSGVGASTGTALVEIYLVP